MKKILLFIIFFSFLSLEAAAQVRISEIMYDLDGTDMKREWIEVENIGSSDVDLTLWKLFEDDTNHKLTHIDGTNVLSSGAFAIIANDTDTFLTDWPSFGGSLFDSSFSLKNTGESLEIRDGNLVSSDQVTYTKDLGASDDGNSLQKIGGSWIASLPTPGAVNVQSTAENNDTSDEESSSENQNPEEDSSSTTGSSGSTFKIEPQIFASAGDDRTVIVGADAEFRGKAIGLKGLPMEAERYVWNFGDGFTKDGKAIFHTYRYPGTYVVILSVASGKYSASDKMIVKALKADIKVSYVGSDRVELFNNGEYELDLSWWILESGTTSFTLPRNTTILPQSALILVQEATNLIVQDPVDVKLLYPNGILASFFGEDPKPVRTTFTTTKTLSLKNSEGPVVIEVPHSTPAPELILEKGELVPEDQIASSFTAASSLSGADKNLYKWLLALVSMLSVAAVAALIVRRNKPDDEIEIID